MPDLAALEEIFATWGESVIFEGREALAIRYSDAADPAAGPGRATRRRVSFEFRLDQFPGVPAAGASIVASDGDWFIKGDYDADAVSGVWRATVEKRARTA